MQFYLDPKRENDPHAIPDAETFQTTADDILCADSGSVQFEALCESRDVPHSERKSWLSMMQLGLSDTPASMLEILEELRAEANDMAGWYWWACLPGCMPDGDPNGPFETEEAAIADAKNGAE